MLLGETNTVSVAEIMRGVHFYSQTVPNILKHKPGMTLSAKTLREILG
jgi:hypothetical protein